MKYLKSLLPFAVLVLVIGFLYLGLDLKPSEIPSPFIGKQAPGFELPRLQEPGKFFKPEEMRGKVWLFNVWASWCVVCRAEHPALLALAKKNAVPVVGLNLKDKKEDAQAWLSRLGNPYVLSVSDSDGRVSIDYGVYGAPETFVIDKEGIIRYKHIGELTEEAIQEKILPLVQRLQKR